MTHNEKEQSDPAMDKYILFREARKKFLAAHPEMCLKDGKNNEIVKFSMICHDFYSIALNIDIPIIKILLASVFNNYSPQDAQRAKEEIARIFTELSLIKEKLNNSLVKLSELTESSRRDNEQYSERVHSIIESLYSRFTAQKSLYEGIQINIGSSNNPSKEIYELLYSCIMELSEISRIINKCTKSLENLLDEHFPVLPESFSSLSNFLCKWQNII
jgi:hypothetical protein